MKRRRSTGPLALLAYLLLGGEGRAQTTVTLTKAPNGQDVLITINGTGPFSVFRGAFPDLSVSPETLVDSQPGTAYSDIGAVQAAAPIYFYDIVGMGETSPATAGGGTPQSAVVLVMVSPNAGKAMDTVTLTGTGFAQFFSENLVTFNGKPALVTAGNSTSLTATVPQGATTGPVQVRVGRSLSNSLPFTVAPVSGFLNLSAIATNPANYHLFVTDSGAAPTASLIEIDPFANFSTTPRGGIANTRGLPVSQDNRLYYSNGSTNTGNGGTIKYWNLTGSVEGTFPNTGGTATTDPVAAVALGASGANSHYVFFADRIHGQVRRIGDVAGRTTYASGFTFTPDFSGAVAGFRGLAFDNNYTASTTNFGDLYVSAGASVWRVHQNNPLMMPDDTTVSSIVPGLSAPSGLTFDDTRTLFITDVSGNSVGVYQPIADRYEARITGLNAPRMAAIARTNDTPPESRLYIAEPTRVVSADDVRLELEPHENIRALISNCPGGASTPGCVGTPYPSLYQTEDRKVKVTAQIHPARSGAQIFFDVEDPPDTAPYGSPTAGDNVGGVGMLSASSAVTDANGKATATLTITNQYAGDNYRVRARLGSAANPVAAKTGFITAWKRVFVEADQMFRQAGQDLTADCVAGTMGVSVADSSRFSPGDVVYLFDALNSAPWTAQVQSTSLTSINFTSAVGVSLQISQGAYVGRVADGFFTSDTSTLYRAYDVGFAELMYRPDGSFFLPFRNAAQLDTVPKMSAFARLWFKNGQAATDGNNYVHALAVFAADSPNIGVTAPSENWSYSNVSLIEAGCSGCSPAQVTNYVRHNLIHELGHQFGLGNAATGTPSWCASTVCSGDISTMAPDTNRIDDVEEFATSELAGPKPTIRQYPDPL